MPSRLGSTPAGISPDLAEQIGRMSERLDALAVSVEKLTHRDSEIEQSLRQMSEKLAAALVDMTDKFKSALSEQNIKSTDAMNALRERYTTEIATLRNSAIKREDLAWVKAFITITLSAAVSGAATAWASMVLFHR